MSHSRSFRTIDSLTSQAASGTKLAPGASPRRVTTSIVIRPDLLAELGRVAATLERSRSFLAEKAIREYLDRHAAARSNV